MLLEGAENICGVSLLADVPGRQRGCQGIEATVPTLAKAEQDPLRVGVEQLVVVVCTSERHGDKI